MQSSRLVAPVDHHNTFGEVIPADHGFGPVEVSRQATTQLDSRIRATTKSLREEFPFNEDVQSGNTIGVGKFHLTYFIF
jgi:hypothetical protein